MMGESRFTVGTERAVLQSIRRISASESA